MLYLLIIGIFLLMAWLTWRSQYRECGRCHTLKRRSDLTRVVYVYGTFLRCKTALGHFNPCELDDEF